MSIISCDFDKTICLGNSFPNPYEGKPNIKLIRYLKEAKKRGNKLILNTMREGDLLFMAVTWCMGKGLEFDAINDNLPEMTQKWGCNPRKVYADYYIDDHNALCGLGKKLPVFKKGEQND